MEWVSANIIVQFARGKTETPANRRPISNKNGTRHSKRLRQARENEKRRFAVTKKTTVKDIKVNVSAYSVYEPVSELKNIYWMTGSRILQNTHHMSTTLFPRTRTQRQRSDRGRSPNVR
jgi:hypothetical protein